MALRSENIPTCFKWNNKLEGDNIILSYKGEFNSELVNSILSLTYRDNNIKYSKDYVKNRLFSVIVESLQNVYKHGYHEDNEEVVGIFLVRKTDSSYCLYTGNFVKKKDKDMLSGKVDQVRKADTDTLKQLQKVALKTGDLSNKSGAGIGLIEIRKKSSHIDYAFQDLDDDLAFFSLEAEVSVAV